MYWKNSNFQTIAFIVGKCHTADEAHRKLLMQRQERNQALLTSKSAALRSGAARAKAQEGLKSNHEWERLEAEATLLDLESSQGHLKACLDEAVREVEFLDALIARLEPLRKYKNLPDHAAFQAIQREEWCLELIQRAQNYLYCNGTIPQDHFATMRAHPDFGSVIRPIVSAMHEALMAKDINRLASYTVTPTFLKAITSDELLGPAPDVKEIFRSIRLELAAKT